MLFRIVLLVVTFCELLYLQSHAPLHAQSPKVITNSIDMRLLLIHKGTFTMGSPPGEVGADEDERQHEVTLTQDYYLGAFEVTQAQYQTVIGHNPSYYQGDKVGERDRETGRVVKVVDSSNHPVDRVSWDDAVEFCRRLSALPKEKEAGRVYRLPTEAEWEYACRGGTETAFSFGADIVLLTDYAWCLRNCNNQPNAVGQKKPNPFGLYDMHGNQIEWCSDYYAEYPQGKVIDPLGPTKGDSRILRGGDWGNRESNCRSAYRERNSPFLRNGNWGFRVAMSLNEGSN